MLPVAIMAVQATECVAKMEFVLVMIIGVSVSLVTAEIVLNVSAPSSSLG